MPEQYDKVSVAESVKTIPPLVKIDLNLDILKTYLEEIQIAVNDHAHTISGMQTDLKHKAYERTMSFYLQKISDSLQRECGERPHAFRLEDSSFLQENYLTEDSLQLKKNAEKMIEKFEIIGLNLINQQKFKTEANERLEKLERQMPKCFTIDMFREE